MRIDFFAQKPRKRKKRKKNSKKDLQNRKNRVIITKSYRWPLSQTVKTSPSHGEDMGSIPVGVTTLNIRRHPPAFLMQDSSAVGMHTVAYILRAVFLETVESLPDSPKGKSKAPRTSRCAGLSLSHGDQL